MSNASPSKLVKPENTLKKKVGDGGFDPKLLEKAQDMIENNTIDFQPIALEFSKELDTVIKGAKDGSIPNEDIANRIMYPAMQLKAQGTLFHYPMITKISHILVDFLENTPEMNSDVLEIIEAYKKSVHAITLMQLKAADNPAGNELSTALAEACDRYYKMKAAK